MKRFLFIVAILTIITSVFAQEDPNKLTNVQGLKIAYFTKQLVLTVEDAQKFWPVYYSFDDEILATRKQKFDNVIAQDEKILAIKKKYFIEFKKVLGTDERANRVFLSERGFGNEIRKVLFNRHQMHDTRPNTTDKVPQEKERENK